MTVVTLAFLLTACSTPLKPDADEAQEGYSTTSLATSLGSTVQPKPSSSPFPEDKCLEQATPVDLPPRREPLKVQFLTEGNLWRWEEEPGVAQQVTSTGDARDFTYSTDGQVIAFVRVVNSTESQLWAVESDGSRLRRLLDLAQLGLPASHPPTAGLEIGLLGWIDQSHVLRVQVLPPQNGIGHVEALGEWAVNADTGTFSPHKPLEDQILGWASPDEQHVAIVTETSISLMRFDGSARRQDLVTYPFIGLGDYAFIPDTRWSPQSQFLRAIIPSADPFAPDASFTTWIIPVEGPPRSLATFNGFPLNVSLSPNQEYLAFWKVTGPMSNTRQLHLSRFDTATHVVYQTGHLLEFLGWAPDSVHFVFWLPARKRPLLGHICGPPRPLLDTTISGWVTWIDGERFLFATGEEPSRELHLGSVDGSNILIGRLDGDFATYRYNEDRAAIGLGSN